MGRFHEFHMKSIIGESVDFSRYDGQLCLVVNVASRCGLTPQYAGLRTLHEQNDERGFQVLGFPCNQFGAQEPGTHEEIRAFTCENYDVSFPLFEKVEVNGPDTCPLYRWLKAGHPDENGNEDIAWNFTKFLVDRSGEVAARYAPQVTPDEIAAVLPQHL